MATVPDEIKTVVEKYFNEGLTYTEIIEFLRIQHNYEVSLSTVKRWLRYFGLRKRPLSNNRSPRITVREAVRDELSGSGAGVGYRRIHRILISKGIACRREDVRKFMKLLDPTGVDLRRRKRLHRRKYRSPGPNFAWHIDGHDKLKLYGFSIHGCIDGFSRKLIWLEVGASNKLPEVVAGFYLEAVSKLKGVPLTIKADDGTEHSLIEPMHIYLRSLSGGQNVNDSFSRISSPQNQRIESYWAMLQRDKIGWWKRLFSDLADLDMLDTLDPVLLDCIHFCFMPLIRKDLCSIMSHWNSHIISKSRNNGPSGRPNCMFHLPHLYEAENFLQQVDQEEVDEFFPVVENNVLDVSSEFTEFAEYFLARDGLNRPVNPEEALNLYIYLLEKIAHFS